MAAIHRHGDLRDCGATTIVSGQSNVYVNGVLVSVNQDQNTHGAGQLTASSNQVYVNNKLVVDVGDDALEDDEGDTDTQSSSGSSNVFVGD